MTDEVQTGVELKKHSALVSMKNEITATQRKMYNAILYLAGKELQKNSEITEFKLSFSEVLRLSGYTNTTNVSYMKSILKELQSTSIEYNILNKDNNQEWGVFSLFAQVSIEAGKEYITVAYPPIIHKNIEKPNVYALLNLGIINNLNSKYTVALYELLTDYKNIFKYRIEITALRKLLAIGDDEYARVGDFKKRCIEPTIAEINEKTDLNIEYELEKIGRTYTSIVFKIKQKKSNLTQLESSAYHLLRSKGLSESNAEKFAKQLSKETIVNAIDILEKAIKKGSVQNTTAYLTTILKNSDDEEEITPQRTTKKVSNSAPTKAKTKDDSKFQEYLNNRIIELMKSISDADIEEFLGNQNPFTVEHLIEKGILDFKGNLIDQELLFENSIFKGWFEKKYIDFNLERQMFEKL